MAEPTSIEGTQVTIRVGDGGSPETFSHPCLINAERGVSFTKSNNDVIVPDCTNPEDPAWRQIAHDSIACAVSGAGILDNVLATIQAYDSWFRGSTRKNVRIYLGSVGYWQGSFDLTTFEVTGERGNKALVNIALDSDGAVAAFTA